LSGRWSLVSVGDEDGKRHLLVRRNDDPVDPAVCLSPRELRICDLAAAGLADKLIADRLGLTSAAVSAALHRARKKLKVTSRAGLAVLWRRRAADAAHAADQGGLGNLR
jgi:DNA-binding CsgD family transcriptional regulator